VKWTNVWGALKSNTMARAFVISIALHFIAFFVIELGYTAGVWKQRAIPKWAIAKNDPTKTPQSKTNEPVVLTFIEVDPAQQSEPPPDAN